MIALLVMTDGRDSIFKTIPSAEAFLLGSISERWIHDDSGDKAHTEHLRRIFPEYRIVSTPGRSGFGGAIASAWSTLQAESEAPFVFHLEDDFVFDRIVDLDRISAVLLLRTHLVQMALRRQPWSSAERAAGGVVEQNPNDYDEIVDDDLHAEWLEHRRFFTTNPSLYRRDLMARGWPTGAHSEGTFSVDLFRDPTLRSAYWGARASGEWCQHIGHTRIGKGY